MLIYNVIDTTSVIVFTIEYILRLWTSPLMFSSIPTNKAVFKYIKSPMAIIDLLTILPFYLPFIFPVDLRVLRVIRLLRIARLFKLHRYSNSLKTVINVFKKMLIS
ncbi:hypothetical protein AZF37_00615 [endosymbiont 'TC1' of Trimyema compressum]|nr:hypothetical protein AZF37_00615 [endosymbiont 'TC1' of Trimyema compressum]